MSKWDYDLWPSGEPYDWAQAARGDSPHDAHDFHVDLGCGKLKKGRIGVDHHPSPGVNVVADLDKGVTYTVAAAPGEDAPAPTHSDGKSLFIRTGLPFDDSSIESIVSHHAFEHIGPGFMRLMDEVYRVLKPGGYLRAITPLFPSRTAVEDPDHKRYFMVGTWESFCGTPDNCWLESFMVPYTQARFAMLDMDCTPGTPLPKMWGPDDAREIRVMLKAMK